MLHVTRRSWLWERVSPSEISWKQTTFSCGMALLHRIFLCLAAQEKTRLSEKELQIYWAYKNA